MGSIVKTSTKPVIEVTDFQRAAFGEMEKGRKALENMLVRVKALVATKYKAEMPHYENYERDQHAFAKLASDKGLTDNQHYRKTYARAVTELYGALPVAMGQEASRKREERITEMGADARTKAAEARTKAVAEGKPQHAVEALASAAAKQAAPKKKEAVSTTLGAPKGETHVHPVGKEESIEQLVARVGMFPLLDAITRVLAADKKTENKAKSLASITAQLVRELKPAEVKKAA